MAELVLLPKLGLTMKEATIASWLVEIGEGVEEGQAICEIETGKAVAEVESPTQGTLLRRTGEGLLVPSGQPIAIVGSPDEDISGLAVYSGEEHRAGSEEAAVPAQQPSESPVSTGRVAASPVARRLAEEHGVDLHMVKGTGPGGRIVKADVESIAREMSKPSGPEGPDPDAEKPLEAPTTRKRVPASPVARKLAEKLGVDLDSVKGTGPRGRIVKADVEAAARQMPEPPVRMEPSQMRKAIAEAMTASAAIPQFALERDVDVDLLERRIRKLARKHTGSDRPTIADAIAMATAKALGRHRAFLRSWSEGTLIAHPSVNLGLAVAVEGGLIVPVVTNADQLSVTEMAARRRELQAKASDGKLAASEMSGGVFTVSNLGPFGVDRFRPLINPPESGILGIGRVVQKEGRSTVSLTLVADHRVVDGALAAILLEDIAHTLDGTAGVDGFLERRFE